MLHSSQVVNSLQIPAYSPAVLLVPELVLVLVLVAGGRGGRSGGGGRVGRGGRGGRGGKHLPTTTAPSPNHNPSRTDHLSNDNLWQLGKAEKEQKGMRPLVLLGLVESRGNGGKSLGYSSSGVVKSRGTCGKSLGYCRPRQKS